MGKLGGGEDRKVNKKKGKRRKRRNMKRREREGIRGGNKEKE
jgi:hypothetical protein